MEGEYLLQIFPELLEGLAFTLVFWLIVLVCSLFLAYLLAILYSFKLEWLNKAIGFYTGLTRGTPLLFQLYFVYFGFPILLGINIDSLTTAFLAFILSWTAYLVEVIRGAILSVDRGQWDAAKVLGLSKWQTMLKIILPQATASALPSISNQAVSLVYGTAILSVLGLDDIMKAARIAVIRDLKLEAFLIAGIFYAIFGFVVLKLFKLLEIKFNFYKRS